MSATRLLGILVFVGGIILITVGIVASRSLADNLSTTFRGHLTQNTMWYIFGGIAAAVLGGILAIFGRSRS